MFARFFNDRKVEIAMPQRELSQLTRPESTNTPRTDTTSQQHSDLSRALLNSDPPQAGPSTETKRSREDRTKPIVRDFVSTDIPQ